MGGCGVRKEASTLENCIQYRKGKTIYKEKHPQVIYTGMEKDETYPIGHTGPIGHMCETLRLDYQISKQKPSQSGQTIG